MKIGVIGSRSFDDYSLLVSVLKEYSPSAIVSGGAKGADSLARRYSEEKCIELIEFLPDWKTFGKGAGMMRNSRIVNESDMLIAFWDGESKGTQDSITKARKLHKKVKIITFKK